MTKTALAGDRTMAATAAAAPPARITLTAGRRANGKATAKEGVRGQPGQRGRLKARRRLAAAIVDPADLPAGGHGHQTPQTTGGRDWKASVD